MSKESVIKWIKSNKKSVVVVVATVLIIGGFAWIVAAIRENSQNKKDGSEAVALSSAAVADSITEYGFVWEDHKVVNGKVKNGDYFSTLLSDMGVSQNDIFKLTQRCEGVFDLGHLKVGYPYEAFFSKEGPLEYLVYSETSTSYVIFNLLDTMSVSRQDKKFEVVEKYVEVEIANSLWADIVNSGASGLLAIKLADIYAWTIDFFGLQKGDSFKAVYEEMSYRGKVVDIGKISYVSFQHLDESHPVYYFEEKGVGNKYWNEKGESTQKAFLKAPLNYSRISSGFTYARRHPITRVVKPHTGVDYAAPMGTPVVSIGDGVVILKRWKGGGGNTVYIKHNSVYQSGYLHLSRYGKGIAVGKRVKQGQIIGYVGSTGMSTGPHLDFRIWKNGTPVNPVTMKSPPSHPIGKESKDAFEAVKNAANDKLLEIQALTLLREKVEWCSVGSKHRN